LAVPPPLCNGAYHWATSAPEYVQKYLDADPSDRSVAGHVLVREEPDEEDDEQGDGEEKDGEEDDDEGYSE
jgi:hypothetical protein